MTDSKKQLASASDFVEVEETSLGFRVVLAGTTYAFYQFLYPQVRSQHMHRSDAREELRIRAEQRAEELKQAIALAEKSAQRINKKNTQKRERRR